MLSESFIFKQKNYFISFKRSTSNTNWGFLTFYLVVSLFEIFRKSSILELFRRLSELKWVFFALKVQKRDFTTTEPHQLKSAFFLSLFLSLSKSQLDQQRWIHSALGHLERIPTGTLHMVIRKQMHIRFYLKIFGDK